MEGKRQDKSERMELARQAGITAMGQTIEQLEKDIATRTATFPAPMTLVFAEALSKYHRGEGKHGFDPAKDTRDLLNQAENDILDAIIRLAILLIKIRTVR